MKKTSKIILMVVLTVLILIGIIAGLLLGTERQELKTIKSEKELLKIFEGDVSSAKELLINIATMPFSLVLGDWDRTVYSNEGPFLDEGVVGSIPTPDSALSGSSSENASSSSKEYSTTNIQVENVDEADIVKTNGDYIYSISDTNVIITNVIDPKETKIEATIKMSDGSVPEELIIYRNELIIISTTRPATRSYSSNNDNTKVKIYDTTQKDKPILIKNYELYEPYYTSRCIDNKLYVIASGNLRKEDEKVITYYKEDNRLQQIELDNIKYLKDVKTTKQTLISVVDLDEAKNDIELSSYLMDISNAYVSEKAIYLLDYNYNNDNPIPLKTLYGFAGAIGPFKYANNQDYGYFTNIYKFDILEDGRVEYNTKTKIKGETINQYSLDEANNHLRIALYDNDGARVAVFDENLNMIGVSDYVAKGEKMYSSRFIGNKAYLVTYKNMDPLFVIDLENEENPKVLGELEIPGYSTYLHPYDENHLIGIGMETKEVVNRNLSGKVTSTTSKIIGMKMALFDVSDVGNPVQLASTVIGDNRTTSAILTNPKALLFSKEKNLIAIPVNNYNEDFEVDGSSDSYSTMIDKYKSYNKSYTAEGYFVYNINLDEGFNLKGIVTHEKDKNRGYSTNTKLLRGLYIENNLYTVSETAVKVNDLDSLNLISELKIEEEDSYGRK